MLSVLMKCVSGKVEIAVTCVYQLWRYNYGDVDRLTNISSILCVKE
jgi:hypothetical protein